MSMSKLAFTVDSFASYCINKGKREGKSEWQIAWELWRDATLRNEEFTPIGKLHRPSGRLTGGKGVTEIHFLQDVFSIPLPVHGTLRVYRKEGEEAE